MTTRKKTGSVFATGMRVVKLGSGAPVPGPQGAYATDNLVKLDFTVEYRDAEEKERLNGTGRACLFYSAPASVKDLTINSLEICYPDPELEALLGGGDVLLDDDDDVIGFAAPEVGSYADPIALELWSSAVHDDGVDEEFPYIRWLFPWERLRPSGTRSISTDPMAAAFEGKGKQNSLFGNGPFNDWAWESSRVYQWVRSASIPDLSANDWVTVPADAPTP